MCRKRKYIKFESKSWILLIWLLPLHLYAAHNDVNITLRRLYKLSYLSGNLGQKFVAVIFLLWNRFKYLGKVTVWTNNAIIQNVLALYNDRHFGNFLWTPNQNCAFKSVSKVSWWPKMTHIQTWPVCDWDKHSDKSTKGQIQTKVSFGKILLISAT